MSFRKVSILVAAGALVAVPAALAGSLPTVPSYSGPVGHGDLKIRPSTIDYDMGSAFLAGSRRPNHKAGPLNWSSWTAPGGRGSGFNWLDNCKPNCASGKFHLFPVKLHFWRASRVHGHRIFTRLTVTYTGKRPAFVHHKTSTWKVVFNSGGYFYNTP
jgi:hypothetical protein